MLKFLTQLFIVLKIGLKFEKINNKIKTQAIKETKTENSGLYFFKITQIETAIRESPKIVKIIIFNRG